MATLQEYIKEYGQYTFFEKEFNEVDAVILAVLSYIDLSGIVPEMKKGKITLREASKRFFRKKSRREIDQNILSIRTASYLLRDLEVTNRFQNLLLYNYTYEIADDMQFGAMCILLPDHTMYVSFEGTDGMVSGWREDCMLTYMFPTSAQAKAINYLNKVVGWIPRKVYVGGHSKGGNLALVASMFCRSHVRHCIKAIYNNDGPGLRKAEFESVQYQKIKPKLHTYIPKYCLVGMLLRHDNDYVVVDSKAKGLLQHNALSWLVDGDKFKRAEISEFSLRVEKGALKWLEKMDDEKREKFVNDLFSIMDKAKITDLTEFKKTKISSILSIIRETRNMDRETRNTLVTCFRDLYNEVNRKEEDL